MTRAWPLCGLPVALGAAVMAVHRAASLSLLTLSCSAFPPTASAASLQRAFGSAEIRADSVPLGETEGDMLPATVFFPHDPRRTISIVWKDTVAKRGPRYVWLSHAPTEWRTPRGISVGTSLRELERLNGRPFHLAGFAFDQSGALASWNRGKLESLSSRSCRFGMNIDSLKPLTPAAQRLYRQVEGGGIFSSGHPAMQVLNPRVSRIVIEYP
jgi:hypothetical protein